MDDTLNIPNSKPNSAKPEPEPANYPDQAAAARAKLDELFKLPAEPEIKQPEPPSLSPQSPNPVAASAPKLSAPAAKPQRRLPSRLKPVAAAAATFVLLLGLFKLPIIISQLRFASQKPAEQPVVITPVASVPANPVISIPKINVTAPIVFEPSYDEAKIQQALRDGVVHYGNTPNPGEPGNSVIVGHSSNDWWEPGNYKFVFVLLDKLAAGDTFGVNYKSKRYIYKVTDVKVVEPTDLSVLASTNQPTMTLITCTPPGTAWKRLIVRAQQISPEPVAATAKATTSPKATLPGSAPSFWEQFKAFWKNLF